MPITFVLDWQDLSLCVLMKLLKLECENALSPQQRQIFPLHIFKVTLCKLFVWLFLSVLGL